MVEYSEKKHRCQACGKEAYINTFGFCAECWDKYSHLRVNKGPKGAREQGEI